MIFGGETLQDFGFALLVGVASGTYSSIFIAAPVLTEWKEREPLYRRRRQIVMEDHNGVVPALHGCLAGRSDRPRRPSRGAVAPAPEGGAKAAKKAQAQSGPPGAARPRRYGRQRHGGGRAEPDRGAPRQRRRERMAAHEHARLGNDGHRLWHFTVWVPDRFWGGIVGAFLVASLGSVDLRLHRLRACRSPRQSPPGIEQALIGFPAR